MRNPGGYAIWTGTDGEGGGVREMDTFTCCHCNSVVLVKPFCAPADAGGFCRMCMKPTCVQCAAKGNCTPFDKKLEAEERRDRFRRQLEGQS